jgi:pimeloyl-ACP methyl ester carboxylesterase
VTDGFAKDRDVILFDDAGMSKSSSEVPTSIEEMAANAAAFIKALGLTRLDVLGFSIGGFIAPTLAIAEPKLVRRVALVGTGPRGGERMATLTPEAQEHRKRSAHSLPGRKSRLAISISRPFRPPCLDVPRGTGPQRVSTVLGDNRRE